MAGTLNTLPGELACPVRRNQAAGVTQPKRSPLNTPTWVAQEQLNPPEPTKPQERSPAAGYWNTDQAH